MTGLAQFFEFDETKVANGQGRILFSPLTGTDDTAVPTGIEDIIGMVSPYAPKTSTSTGNWFDVGATAAPAEYSRQVSLNEWKIQQQLTSILRVPNEVVRTFKLALAEFTRSDLVAMFENATVQSAVSSGTGKSAQELIAFGQFTDLLQYRVAIIGFQPLECGVVTEGSSGPTRPRMWCQFFNRVSVDADAQSINFGIGEMVSVPITLKCYPEPSANQNAEHGGYFFEAAGTIATS